MQKITYLQRATFQNVKNANPEMNTTFYTQPKKKKKRVK